MKHKTVVCGGTFDLFHRGHESFLTQVFIQADKVIIGLTSDLYTNKFKEGISETLKTRKNNLLRFLSSKNFQDRAEIVAINDIYGPLLDKKTEADVIAVTPQTKRAATGINKERENLGLKPLRILVLGMDLAQDGGLISSTRIRNGEIDRKGRLYINPDWRRKTLILPESLRGGLHKPFGKLINDPPNDIEPNKTVTIGDITTQKFNNNKIEQFISVIDFTVKRQRIFNKLLELGFPNNLEVIKVNNLPGQISWNLFQALIDSFKDKKRKIILVNGEEDLAVLPAILSAPLGYKIYYGQPGEGLVEIEVTEEIKEKAFNLANKFNLS